MGVPAIFAGQRTKLLSAKGLLLKDGTTIDNDGVVNFIKNYSGTIGTTGWTEGSYTAASRPSGTFTASSGAGSFAISTTTTTPLGYGSTSFLLTKSSGASRQGRAVETSFALPLSYRAKVLKIEADYIVKSGTFVAGSNSTDSSLIWYCAFSTDGGTTYTVAEPSSFKLLSNSTAISDKFSASIQTPSNATNMKLIAYVAETANSAWVVETIVSVSPSQYVYGTPITDDTSTTYTLSNAGNATVTGTVSKLGNKGLFSGTVTIGATLPTGNITLNLPSGYTMTVSTGYVNSQISALRGTTTYSASAACVSATSLIFGGPSSAVWNATVPATWVAGDTIKFDILVPILGWSSSVQVSDGYEGRVISTKMYPSANLTVAPNASTVKVNMNTALIDKAGSANTSLNRIDIKTSGVYNIKGTIELAGTNVLANTAYRMFVYKNGSAWRYGGFYYAPINGIQVSLIADFPEEDLVAGDYLEAYLYSGGNHSVNQLTVVGSSNTVTSMSVEKLAGNPVISATETISALYTGAPPTGTLGDADNTVTFGTKVKDSHGAYASGTYTVPASGQYDISACVQVKGTFSAWNVGELKIITSNGIYGGFFPVSGDLIYIPIQANVKSIPLRAGDTVVIKTYITGGTGLSYASNSAYNFFSITRTGGY